jgi:hypothetical protein
MGNMKDKGVSGTSANPCLHDVSSKASPVAGTCMLALALRLVHCDGFILALLAKSMSSSVGPPTWIRP